MSATSREGRHRAAQLIRDGEHRVLAAGGSVSRESGMPGIRPSQHVRTGMREARKIDRLWAAITAGGWNSGTLTGRNCSLCYLKACVCAQASSEKNPLFKIGTSRLTAPRQIFYALTYPWPPNSTSNMQCQAASPSAFPTWWPTAMCTSIECSSWEEVPRWDKVPRELLATGYGGGVWPRCLEKVMETVVDTLMEKRSITGYKS